MDTAWWVGRARAQMRHEFGRRLQGAAARRLLALSVLLLALLLLRLASRPRPSAMVRLPTLFISHGGGPLPLMPAQPGGPTGMLSDSSLSESLRTLKTTTSMARSRLQYC